MDKAQSASSDAAWAFLVDFYQRPGVANACLLLQDEAGMDVVELLMLVYAEARLGKRPAPSALLALRAEMAGWREDTVLPLRALRRKLKLPRHDIPRDAKEQLRNSIKKAELLAERLQVDFIAHWLETAPGDGPPLADLMTADSRSGAVDSALALILAEAASISTGWSHGVGSSPPRR